MLREKLWTMVDQYEKPFKVGMYLVVIVLVAGAIWVRAAPPSNTISYQGYLTDTSGRAVSGNLNMNVAFYDAATVGTNLYAETHNNVTVARGHFDLELGAGTPTVGNWGGLDFSQTLWMEITAGGETFAPRIPLSAVPYARFAFQSQQIGTLTAGRWCTSDGSVITCTETAPVTSETDPQVDTLTANQWCAADGTGTAIDCTQSAPVTSETDPQVGSTTNNNWCRGDGSAVQCDQSAPVASETDPQVGSTTNNNWCRGDGSAVQCDQSAPVTSETDPQVDTLTANQWCAADGTGTAIDCTQSAPVTSETDPQVDTLTANQWCAADAGGTAIDCTQSAPVTSETDPQVNTLTASKWCATNAGGTAIDCTQDAPSGGGLTVTVRTSTASALTHYVACSGGETVIGGGCEPTSTLYEFCPATNSTTCSTSPTGWRCGQNVAGNVTVYVICAQ